jgi:radical S-adenosyl methionine domain-containing protein 2
VIGDEGKTRGLLEALATFFAPACSSNPLAATLRWQRTRLNFACGEPLLHGDAVVCAAEHARALGMEVSIITNGSRLTPHLMSRLAPNLSLLRVSADSSAPERSRANGWTDRRGRQMDLSQLGEVVDLGRRMNPAMHVKLNTVVNRVNHHEDMTPFVQALRPDRWKVLRVLPVQGPELTVSGDEFERFVQRHQAVAGVMCVEDNRDMTESYLMVDPLGRFFQNQSAQPGAG